MNYKISYLGDCALALHLDPIIDEQINHTILSIMIRLERASSLKLQSIVPTYQSLLVYFNPQIQNRKAIADFIEGLIESDEEPVEKPKIGYKVPVLYNGEDLHSVAEYHQIPINEVIQRHTSATYYIYMLGFSPGFPYLGGMDKAIATPRLKTPRLKIEVGAVGIADHQTGIYTVPSPGGWQIIGQTPVLLYDPTSKEVCKLQAGHHLRFYEIKKEEFNKIKEDKDFQLKLEVIDE